MEPCKLDRTLDINWGIHILLMGTYKHIHVPRASKCDESISIILHAYAAKSDPAAGHIYSNVCAVLFWQHQNMIRTYLT